jgi:hypothetical protein
LDLGEAKPTTSFFRLEPFLDLLAIGSQPQLGRSSSRVGGHRAGALGHRNRQRLVRFAATWFPAQLARNPQPTPDRPLRLPPSNPS